MARATVSKSARAYEFIAERIRDGRFAPGTRLVLDPIAQQLGVSVVPVREAIRRLEAEGLVTFRHNAGAQVALVHEDEYVTTMQTLSIVEGAATALASPRVSTDDIARARAINDQLSAMLGDDFDPVRFTRLNQDFHAVLFEHCPNEHLIDLVHRGWARLTLLRESTFSFVPDRAAGSVEEHEQLLRLIERGADPLEVELAARRHRTTTMDAYLASRHG
jgi:DNA-binding GntR family transcriptional regulator